ncbi:hypothetical protein C4556_01075 [Candidatus Parcubacteria bacterium]|nr:MAG: hypothetical protein C4556_01075 [Candidatus Parcubacteria bacterium]
MWQDFVILGVQIVFAFSVVPTILHPTQKPTLSTALMTAGCISTMAFVFASLHLWLAVTMAVVNAGLWGILAAQRYRLNQKSL